jgi:hypothetical protein
LPKPAASALGIGWVINGMQMELTLQALLLIAYSATCTAPLRTNREQDCLQTHRRFTAPLSDPFPVASAGWA